MMIPFLHIEYIFVQSDVLPLIDLTNSESFTGIRVLTRKFDENTFAGD